jgi:hypothetical protein
LVLGILAGTAAALCSASAFAGDLEVVTKVGDGKAIVSGVLIADGQSIPIADGAMKALKGLPDKRIAVTVDALVLSGKNKVRYLGVTAVKTLPGASVPVTVTLQPVADVEAFCTGCHPSRGEAVKPDQVMRDVHVSNKELTEKYLAQVKAYNEKVQVALKNKAPNPSLPIPFEERLVKVAGKEVKKFFFTCESCHTTHLKTSWGKSARASFDRPSTLCTGCHY